MKNPRALTNEQWSAIESVIEAVDMSFWTEEQRRAVGSWEPTERIETAAMVMAGAFGWKPPKRKRRS